jgi:hypothetical protein
VADLARKRRRIGPQLGHRELSKRLEKVEAVVGSRYRAVFGYIEMDGGGYKRLQFGGGPPREPGPEDFTYVIPVLTFIPAEEAARAAMEQQAEEAAAARAAADAAYAQREADRQGEDWRARTDSNPPPPGSPPAVPFIVPSSGLVAELTGRVPPEMQRLTDKGLIEILTQEQNP